MIWTSTAAMTVVDLLVVALAAAMFRFAASDGFFRRHARGRALISLGVLAIGAFYLTDLLAMHVGPLLVDPASARRFMEVMHLDALWIVMLLAVGLIAAGFLSSSKTYVRDERRLSLMTDALPLAVAYVDSEERYQFVNARYAKLHALTPQTMMGAKVADVVRADLYERFREHDARALRGEAQTYEHRARLDLDGQMHDLHVDLVPEFLEGRVAGFFLLVLDVTHRVQLERDVVRAAEAERLSVARDLHDGLGQSLTGISLALGALARRLDQEGSKQVNIVTSLTATAQKTIEQVRQFTHLLAPTMQGGLFSALRTLAKEVNTLYDVECLTRCPPDEVEIPPAAAMHLYRIAQESVNNAARHGRASTIRIDCRLDGGALVLEVADDGLGIPARDERHDGLGLKSMYYRARMIGGILEVTALQDGGTEVSCRVLLSSLAHDGGAHPGTSSGPAAISAPNSDRDASTGAGGTAASTMSADPGESCP